ncbi:MAG TPA: hypothetical protein VMC48_05955, partial [Methanobacterium sp.]|nr:hypothetical protein [Methanobacterium sp.]
QDSNQRQLQIIIKKLYKLEAKNDDVNKRLENLDGLGEKCPICGSVLDEPHKKNLKVEREKEIRKYNSEIKVLNEVKTKGEFEVEQNKSKVEGLEKELYELEIIKSKYQDYTNIKNRIQEINEQIYNINEAISINFEEGRTYENFNQYIEHLEDISLKIKEYEQAQESLENIRYQYNKNIETMKENQSNIENLKGEVGKLKEVLSNYNLKIEKMSETLIEIKKLQTSCADIEARYRAINGNIISTQTLIKRYGEDVLRLEKEIKEKEMLRKQLTKLKDYHIWLHDYLIPTLSVIEKHVMQNIHLEFDDNFKKWFNLLIDDPSKTGKIDEEFTPIVEQDGFEQEINYLSGGEKTSVALAYRLALNNIVQKVSTGMKSNLLIMDEPTDGFSKEQLFKIREILGELKYPQIIVVSHEKELESFADNIFQIEKIDGVSEVSQV